MFIINELQLLSSTLGHLRTQQEKLRRSAQLPCYSLVRVLEMYDVKSLFLVSFN